MKRVCFILTHVPDPRINKRIDLFKKFATVTIVCVRRADQNIWEPKQDVEHIILDIDLPSSRHPVLRFFMSYQFRKAALKIIKKLSPDIIFTEGLDSLNVAREYQKQRKQNICIFFEVCDLRDFYFEHSHILKRKVSQCILHYEKKIFHVVNYLIVTSLKFYTLHYHKLIPQSRVLYIPNIPKKQIFSSYKKRRAGEFTVGFIGGIRYLNQMKMLVDASVEVNCKVVFAGAGGTRRQYEELIEYCTGKDNIIFTGKYDYEKDIASLYGQIDCVYSVYDADDPNVRIALPNKLYEAILCELPIIVAKKTYLADLVSNAGIGITVSHTNINELIYALKELKLNNQYYNSLVYACRNIQKEFFYTEQDKLCDILKKITRK